MNTIMNNDTEQAPVMTQAHTVLVAHPHSCSTENYLDPQYAAHYMTLAEFLDGHGSKPIELNLCFPCDIEPREDNQGFRAFIFTVQQRRGVFLPVTIEHVRHDELDRLEAYLQRHWKLLKQMWTPLAG